VGKNGAGILRNSFDTFLPYRFPRVLSKKIKNKYGTLERREGNKKLEEVLGVSPTHPGPI